MIERAQNPSFYQGLEPQPRKVLRMQQGDRTAGSIPVWETPSTPSQQIEANLSAAQNPQIAQNPERLAFQANQPQSTDDEFGFADLLDMVNPLQHIPVVSYLYREITGDTIKPAAQVIGGAVFGGALGAASGLVNVVIAEETGGGVAENALTYAKTGKTPKFRHNPDVTTEARTASYAPKATPQALSTWAPPQNPDLPVALLAFTTPDTATAQKTTKSAMPGFSSFTLNA